MTLISPVMGAAKVVRPGALPLVLDLALAVRAIAFKELMPCERSIISPSAISLALLCYIAIGIEFGPPTS